MTSLSLICRRMTLQPSITMHHTNQAMHVLRCSHIWKLLRMHHTEQESPQPSAAHSRQSWSLPHALMDTVTLGRGMPYLPFPSNKSIPLERWITRWSIALTSVISKTGQRQPHPTQPNLHLHIQYSLQVHICIYVRMHTHRQDMHTHTYIHIHTHTHACTHARTHTHTHTHTHTQSYT